MKMSKEDYEFIKSEFKKIKMKDVKIHFEHLKTDKGVKDINMRLRWDCFYCCKPLSAFFINTLYPKGLNDDHIDTALKQIAKELNFPTVTS